MTKNGNEKWDELNIKGTKQISWKQIIDSEFKIGSWHVMNRLITGQIEMNYGLCFYLYECIWEIHGQWFQKIISEARLWQYFFWCLKNMSWLPINLHKLWKVLHDCITQSTTYLTVYRLGQESLIACCLLCWTGWNHFLGH